MFECFSAYLAAGGIQIQRCRCAMGFSIRFTKASAWYGRAERYGDTSHPRYNASWRLAIGWAGTNWSNGAQLGKVACGNVGSPIRFDCSVIGPPVNKLSRLESMCDPIERRLLLSEACAAAILEDGPVLPSLGCHGLRSVRKPVNLFTLENLPES